MRTQEVMLLGLLLLGGTAAAQSERENTVQPPPLRAPSGLSAQEEVLLHDSDAAPPAGPSIARRAFGLTEEPDGRLLGGGPDYRVRFEAGGPVVTTALGASAPRSLPLAFELESVSLGSVPLAGGGPASPARAAENEVVYLRAGGVEERYDVRREGVEQSFVFHELPSVAGDLVVLGRVTTELAAPEPTAEGGLLFRAPREGGVRVGAVLGIDADGRTAPGTVRWRAPFLELSLPGDFVADAALPLVLDPMIGPLIIVNDDLDEVDPDVAYDATNDVYLVAWERQWSGGDIDIRAQRVSGSGTLLGGFLTLEGAVSPVSMNPAVGNVTVSDRFLVAWQEGTSVLGAWDIRCRAVDADDGALSATVTVSADAASEVEPDVGGDAGTGDDDVVVVWRDLSQGIRLAQVTVPITGAAPSAFGEVAVSADANDQRPAVSKSGGSAGVYLVCWQRYFSSPAPGDHDAMVRLVSKDSVALTPAILIASTVGPDEEDLDNDGDGSMWLLAYEKEAVALSGDNDIVVRQLSWNGVSFTIGPEVEIEGDAFDDEVNPAVAWTGSAWVVVYADAVTALDADLLAEVVTPGPALCGGEVSVSLGTSDADGVEIAAQRSGSTGDASRQAMIVWQDLETGPPFDGEVTANFFRNDTGLVTDLGGGCGGGGTASLQCAIVGNAGFVHRLEGANPSSTAFLLLGFSELGVSCGTCTLVPNPFESLVFTTVTDGSGDASVAMPIPGDPNLVGATFLDQWVVLGGSACSAISSDLSNALRVVIQ